jgi:probable rRNA maturation factor
MSKLDIRNFTRSTAPAFPFQKALEAALPGWEISLVFAGERRAQALNMQLRNKEYIPNVLSYVSGEKSGEIIICPAIARKQAPTYELSYTAMVGFLFIHGLMHLKGLSHGATMERREREILSHFIRITSTDGTTHRDRHRYRNAPHQSGRGRGNNRA